jgi:hypothetical protein
MGLISEEIKKVKRPEHTEVRLLNGIYYVYPYISVWSKEKKKPIKHSLPYVGKIVFNNSTNTYVFESALKRVLNDEPEIKTFGDVALLDKLGISLYKELASYYGDNDAKKIYVYSILRLLTGDSNSYLDDEYINSYISELYPNVAVSKNSVLDFIKILGNHENTNKKFLESRIKKEHKVLIFDGTRIDNASKQSSLTEYGKDAYKTSNSQITEVRVYDIDIKEPIYYELVPGNVIDKVSFIKILDLFDVKDSIVVVDKGFNTKENIKYLLDNNINFIVPMNDNSTSLKDLVKNNKYTDVFKYDDKTIKAFKKEIINEDNKKSYAYIYKDPSISSAQESSYINKIVDDKKGYNVDKLNNKDLLFGAIGFITNMDTEIRIIYDYYKERWLVENNFRLEKTSIDNEAIRVHSTAGVYGVRFLMCIENIIISRLYKYLKEKNILKKYSCIQTLKKLSRYYVIFRNNKWKLSITTKKNITFLIDLDIDFKHIA